MKKGLTMLVAAMVVLGLICVIGSAAATTTEAAIGPTAAAAIGVALFLGVMTIGVVLFMRWKAKKSPDYKAGRLVKSLNAAVLMVLTAVNATYTQTTIERVATSPKMISRTYGID